MRYKKPAIVTGKMPTATQQEIMADDMHPRDVDHKVKIVKRFRWLPLSKWNSKIEMED